MKTKHSYFSILVLCCFFLSGIAGLVYQIIWVRLIDKVIGSAPFAVSTILSIFMGGLALGSFLAGKYIDRLKSKSSLLYLYGGIEAFIGAYALMLPSFINKITPVYRLAYDSLFPYFWTYQIVSFLGCLILMIIPTSLMGATLPILCRFYVTHLDHLGTRTGRLYGLNTIGAAIGAILCGFILIGRLGVWGAICATACINFLVGSASIIAAAILKRFENIELRLNSSLRKSQLDPKRKYVAPNLHNALCIFAVSGFCAMSYEVIWTRLIGLILGPTTYSFTLVVSSFIIGLSAGSIIFGKLSDRIEKDFPMLAFTQIAAACMAVGASQFLGNSQFFFSKLIHYFLPQGGFSKTLIVQSVPIFLILLGPTLFLGAAFPLVSRLSTQSIPSLGTSIGAAYAVNTIGAIAGSFAAGFILIPAFGKEISLKLVIGLQFCTGFILLFKYFIKLDIYKTKKIAAIAISGLWMLFIVHFPSWNQDVLSRGWYRNFQDIENELDRTSWFASLWQGTSLLAEKRQGVEIVFHGEGIGGFTTVEKEITSVGLVEYALYNSGKPDASSHGDRASQTLSGHLPLIFHPNPKNIMIIGLASGMTSGEALLYPVKHLDILEINEQVTQACRAFFTQWNNNCLNDPRTRLIVQDGRNHLALTRDSYDVIISVPSNPWMAGLANLYSLDFFRLARNHLNNNGIFAQWIQSYEMDWDTFALVGRTFTEVFPEGALMKMGPGDYLLLGFSSHKRLNWKAAERNIIHAQKSGNVVFPDFRFLVHLVVTEDLPEFFGKGKLHTDNLPCLEFSAPVKMYEGDVDLDKIIAGRRSVSSETIEAFKSIGNLDAMLDLIEFAASAYLPCFSLLNPDDLDPSQRHRYMKLLELYCRNAQVPSFRIFPNIICKQKCAEIQVKRMKEALAMKNPQADDHYNLALALMAAGQHNEAESELAKTISISPNHKDCCMALGLLHAGAGRFDEAVKWFLRVIEISPGDRAAINELGSEFPELKNFQN